MDGRDLRNSAWRLAACFAALLASPAVLSRAHQRITPAPDPFLFDDVHLHLTNYVQQGTDMRALVTMMGTTIGRSTVFGIPLQQEWSYGNTGDYAPTYYL